jgi:hypothetical protein
MQSHLSSAVVDLGQVGVVTSTREHDVLHAVVTALAERAAVVELEPFPRGAAPPLFVDVVASAFVAFVHGALDGGRDVARRWGRVAL